MAGPSSCPATNQPMADPSLHPKAPLPLHAKPKLVARIASPKGSTVGPSDPPEYNSRIHSDGSMWDNYELNCPEHFSNRKHKRGIPEPALYNPLGDKLNHITANYLTKSTAHTVDDLELVRALADAKAAFTTEQEKKCRNPERSAQWCVLVKI